MIKGASQGEGLGNQFLANIREVDAIIHVIRCFEDDNVVHVDGSVDPVRDKEIIDTELLLKDLETVEKRLEKLRKAAKTGQKEEVKKVEIGENIKIHLEEGKSARSLALEEDEVWLLDDMMLLTAKPILYVCNVDEDAVEDGNEFTKAFAETVINEDAEVILISAGIEADIAELESKEERLEFLNEMGLSEPGVNKLISACYKLLNFSQN